MGILNRITEALGLVPVAELREQVQQRDDTLEIFEERLAELELSLEDASYQRLSAESQHEFSRAGLRQIAMLARLYWLKNPLIKRAVEVQQCYVFGQGVTIVAPEAPVNAIIQAFLNDPKNAAELTSHQALEEKEAELQITANLFFALFTDLATGAVRVRTIPFTEVDDVISNPEDKRDKWFYLRRWTDTSFSASRGAGIGRTLEAYYPDWRHKPTDRPEAINGKPVIWDAPIFHVATNKLGDMRFGVSELYAAIDWAKAYKSFLEDWATIVRAYSRFAWNLTTKGGTAGVARAKAKLGTTLGADSGVDRNPPPATASTFITTEGNSMTPIKTAGATTDAEDGRRLLLMVCAATGIYEHYFGDPSTGNLATSTSMERPMELKFLTRRRLWSDTLGPILEYVIEAAVRARKLPGVMVTDDYGVERPCLGPNPDAEDGDTEPMKGTVNIDFPSLLDHNLLERIQALVAVTTLSGQTPAGTIDLPTFTKACLTELGWDNVSELIEQLFPEGWEEERAADAAAKVTAAQQAFKGQQKTEDGVAEALRGLREAVKVMYDRKVA